MNEIKTATLELSDRDEPIVLTNINILQAMAADDPSENHNTKNWYIGYGDYDYGLKWIVARAAEHATGESVSSRKFHTDSAKEVVEELGFNIVER